jgi:hypothetical protein
MKHVTLVVEEWVALYSCIDADVKNASQRALPVVDPAVAFYDTRKARLLATYVNGGGTGAGTKVDWNSNISTEFYDKQKYKAVLEEYNNVLETQWKTRVLMETTPRGNVLMYFDPYKMGFAYFADHHVPYTILNAIAMRYVMVYRCRDFFTDEFVIPDEHKSPLLDLRRVDEKKKTGTVGAVVEGSAGEGKDVNAKSGVKDASAPFAKLKSYNKSASFSPAVAANVSKSGGNGTENTSKPAEKLQLMNAFVYLGKICNFSVIQKTPKQHVLNGFSTRFDGGKKISWAEFKQQKQS